MALAVAVACQAWSGFAATPTITGVTAKQRKPWNGKVDITFTVTGDVKEGLPVWNKPFLSVSAADRESGTNYIANATALSGDTGTDAGLHHVVWDLDTQGLAFKSDDVIFTVAFETIPQYCVIDLSAGANASSYPVTYFNAPPSGGFNADEYKTTKLVLRLIEPGTFMMCGWYETTLTKAFYCGVFEVTQRQYELVTGNKPSFFNNASYYATRPVEQVWYDMIRGSSAGACWPESSGVDGDSFLGKLRAKTGLDFDLPTEAQWEYACRAGTTTDYNSGKNNTGDSCANMNEVGRYWYNGGQNYDLNQNCSTFGGTAEVGSYRPNAWGLYDMHGNVDEWCLDWNGSLSSPQTDPLGSSSGAYRVLRGGSCLCYAYYCRSSFRRDHYLTSNAIHFFGFRLVRTLSD